jgi:hypothetical protein
MSSMTRQGIMAVVAATLSLSGLLALRADAVPRYAARYGQRCGLCHVNPSGAGMRTAYASQQLVPEELAWGRGTDSLSLPGPQLSPTVSIGADFRELYVGSTHRASNLDFFQMQGDLYVAFQLDPKTTLYFDRGMSNSYELFGTAYVLPLTGYVKAGRFVPSYGWKFDDHTMYVRSELGLAPPLNSDVGIELGLQPGPLDMQLGLVNGSRGSTLDTDNSLAQSLNVIYRRSLAGIGWGVGTSGYHQRGPSAILDVGGGYGYLTWHGLSWLAEADFARTSPRPGPRTTAFVTSQELSYLVRPGLELLGTYDFHDPDLHLKSGARSRWGGGVHVMPRPYAAIEALYRKTEVDTGPAITAGGFDETVLQLHLVY